MNPERLEDAIYKNSPGIELYRKKVVQYLKQAVMERIATFPYNLDGTIQQATPRPIQSQNESLSCPMCDATFTSKCFLFDMGSFTNYVDQFSGFFNPPPLVDSFT